MMHTRRHTIGYSFLLILLSIPAWAPLIRPGLPQWRAGALPVFRLYAFDWGQHFDIVLLPAYLLHRARLDGVAALKVSLALGVILIALSLFFGIRRLWGDKAGVLAGVLVIYSPILLSALYIEGAVAAVWLLLGATGLVWMIRNVSWQQRALAGLGLILAIIARFHISPTPPFSYHLLFETPWPWQQDAIDLHSAFAWTPGLIALALAMIVVWALWAQRPHLPRHETRLVWESALAWLLVLTVLFWMGQLTVALLIVSLVPLVIVASYVFRLFPILRMPGFWAALLILPILAAGPSLSPNFVQYPIPPQPAAIFGQQRIMLIDVGLSGTLAPGQKVAVDAVWQAVQPIDFDYNIFIHVVDDAGQTVAQFDGQPRQGERPMTTWLPGEILIDRYELAIPADAPASLHVQLGLYNWQTLQRLPLAAGGDSLTIDH